MVYKVTNWLELWEPVKSYSLILDHILLPVLHAFEICRMPTAISFIKLIPMTMQYENISCFMFLNRQLPLEFGATWNTWNTCDYKKRFNLIWRYKGCAGSREHWKCQEKVTRTINMNSIGDKHLGWGNSHLYGIIAYFVFVLFFFISLKTELSSRFFDLLFSLIVIARIVASQRHPNPQNLQISRVTYVFWKKKENGLSSGASSRKCSPADSLILVQWDPCWTFDLQNSKIINFCCLNCYICGDLLK